MACDRIDMPGGLTAIVCRSRRRTPSCKTKLADGTTCGGDAVFQCDWKITKTLTCDRHVCGAHALEVSAGKHLCPDHQEAYRIWRSRQPRRSIADDFNRQGS